MIRENSDSTLFKYAFDAYTNNIFFFLRGGGGSTQARIIMETVNPESGCRRFRDAV